MVHKTIFEHYVEEILGDDLKLEGNDESKERMYQLAGLGKPRKEPEQVSTGEILSKTSRKVKEKIRANDTSANVELEKFGHLWKKCEEYASSPRLCGMEGVDVLVAREQKGTKRAEKRERIPVQMMSRLCNCFMVRTSLAETKLRRREIKSSKEKAANGTEGYVRSKKRIQVDQVNLFCHGGSLREEKETPDPRRAAEQKERIQHQREKLIEPYLYTYKSSTSKGAIQISAPPEARGCMMANHLRDVCDVFRQQQTPQSRARPSNSSDENKVPAKSNFTKSSASVSSGMGQPTKTSSLGKTGHKVEVQNKDTSVTRTSKGPSNLAEKKQRAASTTASHDRTTVSDKDITVGPATSQLQRSTSLKEYFEAERKAEVASQAQKLAEDIDAFHEIEGESPHHRRLRYEGFKHLQSCKRAARKIEAINQQEEARQREHEEKTKAAYELDPQIKRWSCGKEGNLRSLLSSLHNVLWPECKWKCVAPSELVTPGSVKKVYRRASFCLHPDKVQQKGGTLEQKYVAEKVFGVLREAWNKFYSEELA